MSVYVDGSSLASTNNISDIIKMVASKECKLKVMKKWSQLHEKSRDTFIWRVGVNVYNPERRYCVRLAVFIVNNQTRWYKPKKNIARGPFLILVFPVSFQQVKENQTEVLAAILIDG
jgi:hypothetical protein